MAGAGSAARSVRRGPGGGYSGPVKSTDKFRRRAVLIALIVAGGTVTLGCSGGDVREPTAAAETPSRPTLVSPTEGQALMDDGAVLIDVRTPAEFAEARIDGAVLIDVSAADFDDRIAELDPSIPYVVYCRSGNRSAAAVDRMTALGLTEVYDMGGIIDWVDLGYPVVTG